MQGVRNVASVCLQIGYPTVASVPHSIINGYKRVLALSVETDYTFPLAEKVRLSSQDRRGLTGQSVWITLHHQDRVCLQFPTRQALYQLSHESTPVCCSSLSLGGPGTFRPVVPSGLLRFEPALG